MTANQHPNHTFTLARRAERMNPSIIREILKVTERPGITSLAGGLPAPDSFPIQAMREASERVLRDTPHEALQYAASEGYGPLREWVADTLGKQGMRVQASQILITTGSQQGLDLVGKVLIDPESRVLVEAPTYLGALQAFAPYEPRVQAVLGDSEGPLPEALERAAADRSQGAARFMYLLPNFQNPSGHLFSQARRDALIDVAQAAGLPLVEDNPYGDLWYDEPPPKPLASGWPEGVLYLGSFSKILAPGLRLGFVAATAVLYPKLLQAKQAADLHTPSFNQRIAHEVIRNGFLDQHMPRVRELYRARRDAMVAALDQHFKGLAQWNVPSGGMFCWLTLNDRKVDTLALLPKAVEAGVAYVPGAAFYAQTPPGNTLRLSFVTVEPARIEQAVATLARVVREASI